MFRKDINEKALTFISRESYLKRNYLSNATDDEKEMLKNIFKESILINIRTYDTHSLVLYVNDHYNNFVHLYITNSNEVVYLYNYGDEIVNLTIVHEELNSGKSIQVAVIRTETETTMHVNEKNITVEKGYRLLEEYSNRPWVNPEKGNVKKVNNDTKKIYSLVHVLPTIFLNYILTQVSSLCLSMYNIAYPSCIQTYYNIESKQKI